MGDEDEERALRIRCGTHAERAVAVVCGHLLVGDGERVLGFIENSSDPDDLQGWCEDCEWMFVREGEMTDAFLAFNDMRVVCDLCYAGIRERHTRPAPYRRRRGAARSDVAGGTTVAAVGGTVAAVWAPPPRWPGAHYGSYAPSGGGPPTTLVSDE